MNQLQTALSDICNAHRLREKILIAPSFSQGHFEQIEKRQRYLSEQVLMNIFNLRDHVINDYCQYVRASSISYKGNVYYTLQIVLLYVIRQVLLTYHMNM